jgi:hypothetical protein
MSETYKRYPFEYDIPPVPPPNTFYVWSTPDGSNITPEAVLDTMTLTSTGGSVLITGSESTDTINFEVNPAGIGVNAVDEIYISAEAITIRDVVYKNGTTNQIGRASNSAYSTSKVVGIALSSVGVLTNVSVRRLGRVPGFTGLTIGDVYFLDSTSGQITNVVPLASGAHLVRVGIAASATELDLDIQIIAVRA